MTPKFEKLLDQLDESYSSEALLALQEEAKGYSPDWPYGCTCERCMKLLYGIGEVEEVQ